jgi:hypothetical protein
MLLLHGCTGPGSCEADVCTGVTASALRCLLLLFLDSKLLQVLRGHQLPAKA